jgi:beta-glucoside operon transcriptional antiterminator
VDTIKVRKVLNNNVIVTRCDKNKEVIVMGKGLAFGLKMGDDIDQDRIDKTFALNSSKEVSRFQELMEQVSEECLEISEQLIDFAKERLGKKLNNSIYITLTDHINTMIERAKIGAYLKNTMLLMVSP